MDRVLESESILKRLSDSWWSHDHPRRGRSYTCQCGRSVFFRDSKCRACAAPLGYDHPGPERRGQPTVLGRHRSREAPLGLATARCGVDARNTMRS
jgi:hypothetical protein